MPSFTEGKFGREYMLIGWGGNGKHLGGLGGEVLKLDKFFCGTLLVGAVMKPSLHHLPRSPPQVGHAAGRPRPSCRFRILRPSDFHGMGTE
eukprot:jgi/Tetstr1/438844/TSEL_027353.t1